MLLELRTGGVDENERSSSNCRCLPNCIDSVINFRLDDSTKDTHELVSSYGIKMTMKNFPLVRYKRKILFSLIDLYGNITLII